MFRLLQNVILFAVRHINKKPVQIARKPRDS